MKFSKGYKVPKPGEIHEEFEIRDRVVIANVSDENIKSVLFDFINTLEEPAFFILELPLTKIEEEKFKINPTDPFHHAVYYIDGCTKDQLRLLLVNSGDLLINDGLCSFGFASHHSHAEMTCSKYNVVSISSNKIEDYSNFYNKYGMRRVDKIITAWDTFSRMSYGEACATKTNGKDVYSIIEDYKAWGIYKGEVRAS